MSNSVENQVVGMKFDNKQFMKGAQDSLSMLDKLKAAMGFKIKSPVDDINSGASKVNLNPITGAIEGVNKGFLAMATIAVTALANITNKAVDAGLQMASSLTFTPIKEGFLEYESLLTKQNTIMNATGKSAGEVKAVLNDLNHYSDQTIYSFSNMTDSIQKFVNAGVSLPQSVKSIKGIANAAAFAGASTEEANRAMYAFSQAMSTGFVGLQDWNQIENANMGTQQFKNTLLETAVASGELTKKGDMFITKSGKAISATKGWREGLQEQWATTEVLNKALAKYTDQSTALGRKAQQAATEVRTFSAFMDTLKESLGSGWASVFGALVGNLDQSTKLWTGLSNAVNGSVGSFFKWLTTALQTWRAMGGFEKTLQGFKNILAPIGALFSTIGAAFREAFPASDKGAGKALYGLSAGFELITRPLQWLADLIRLTLPIWTLFFEGIALGVDALKALGRYLTPVTKQFADFFDIISNMGGGNSSFALAALAGRFETLGPILVTVIRYLQQVGGVVKSMIQQGFAALGPILDDVGNAVQSAMDKIKGAIGNFSVGNLGLGGIFDMGDGASKAVKQNEQVQTALAGTEKSADKAAQAFDWLKGAAQTAWDGIVTVLSTIKNWIQKFFADMGIQEGLALVNTGFFIAMYISIKSLSDKLGGMFESFGQIGESASGVLNQLTDNLKTMQNNVRANILIKIAIALAILTAAIVVLSRIDVKALGTSLGAIMALLIMLTVVMKALGVSESLDPKKMVAQASHMTLLGLAMVAMATAILILAFAAKKLSELNLVELGKGLGAVAVMMVILAKGSQALNAAGGGKQMIAAAFAMILLAAGLLAMSYAMKKFVEIDFWTMMEGLSKVMIVLIGLNYALKGMKASPAGALALIIVAGALLLLARSLSKISEIGIGDLIKTVLTLAYLLPVLTLAINSATGGSGGAAAILIMSVALIVLQKALAAFAAMDWGALFKSLGMLIVTFAVLGGASLLLAPAIPIFALFAAALLALGVAMLAAGTGMLLFALALASLAVTGVAGTAALTATIIAVSELIPLIAQQIGLGILAIATVISEAGPTLIRAFTTILLSLIEAGIRVVPRFGRLISVVVRTILRVLASYYGDLVDTGVELLIRLLNGIGNAIPRIGGAVERIYNRMLSELSRRLPRMADAGLKAIIRFINGMSQAIDDNADDLREAGRGLAFSIVDGVTGGLLSYGIDQVRNAVNALMDHIPGWARDMLHINSPSKRMIPIGIGVAEGTALGIDKGQGVVESSVSDLADVAVRTAQDTMRQLARSLSVSDDFNPTITPVLDLSQMAADASKIGALLPGKTITAASYSAASDIANAQDQALELVGTEEPGGTNVTINQTNTSPEALDEVQIYRNTKSAISIAKEALK